MKSPQLHNNKDFPYHLLFYELYTKGINAKSIKKSTPQHTIIENLLAIDALECENNTLRLKPHLLVGSLDIVAKHSKNAKNTSKPQSKDSQKKAFLSPFYTPTNIGISLDSKTLQKDFMLKDFPPNANKGDILIAKIRYIKQGKRAGVMINKLVAEFIATLVPKIPLGVCVLIEHKNAIVGFALRERKILSLKATQKSLRTLPKHAVLQVNMQTCEIIEVLGVFDNEAIDKDIVLKEYGVEQEFSHKCVEYTQNIEKSFKRGEKFIIDSELYPHREDYTHIPFCVIDPKDAKDHDDAIYYDAKTKKLYVAIADVGEYVAHNTLLDKDAQQRCFSVYFPDCVIPMLPFALSSGLCSLQAGLKRLALVWEIHINNGEMLDCSLKEGIIKVREHFTYEQVADFIESNTFNKELLWLKSYMTQVKKLRAKRLKNGYEFEGLQAHIRLKGNGEVASFTPKTLLDSQKQANALSHSIIEESMLLANVASANLLATISPKCAMYRIHEAPKPQKIAELFVYAKSFGNTHRQSNDSHLFKKDEKQSLNSLHAQITQIQKQAKILGLEQIIDWIIIKAQCKAIYSHIADSHFGLGFACYTHFTSPIRRYSDLCVHRILKAHLHKSNEVGFLSQNLCAIARELNIKEREYMRLWFDFLDLKFARFCAKNAPKLTCRAVVIDDSSPMVCVALDCIPEARIIVESASFGKLSIVHLRIIGANIFTREIFGEVIACESEGLPKQEKQTHPQKITQKRYNAKSTRANKRAKTKIKRGKNV